MARLLSWSGVQPTERSQSHLCLLWPQPAGLSKMPLWVLGDSLALSHSHHVAMKNVCWGTTSAQERNALLIATRLLPLQRFRFLGSVYIASCVSRICVLYICKCVWEPVYTEQHTCEATRVQNKHSRFSSQNNKHRNKNKIWMHLL